MLSCHLDCIRDLETLLCTIMRDDLPINFSLTISCRGLAPFSPCAFTTRLPGLAVSLPPKTSVSFLVIGCRLSAIAL